MGQSVETVGLSSGLWKVEMEVDNNQDCSLSVCIDSNFIVEAESVNGSGWALIANEIAEHWVGATTVRVGDGLLDDLQDGQQLITVDAIPEAEWLIVFSRP